MRLYDFFVLPTLLCGSETRNLTKVNLKQLEAARHRWQRKILGTVSGRTKSRMKNYARKRAQTPYKTHFEGTTFKTVGRVNRMETCRVPRYGRSQRNRSYMGELERSGSQSCTVEKEKERESIYIAQFTVRIGLLSKPSDMDHTFLSANYTIAVCYVVQCASYCARKYKGLRCLSITTKFRIWQTKD